MTIGQIRSEQVKRVLLVDDDHSIRELLLQIIESFGYDVIEAANGKQALTLFEQNHHSIDLLMTDICMPQMDGSELIGRVRHHNPLLPIIAITGFADAGLLKEVERLNAVLIYKPIDIDSLHCSMNAMVFDA
ncbi:response regulator [Mariprofundus erugo]|nr:response regulator [Mariprofundus erugo]